MGYYKEKIMKNFRPISQEYMVLSFTFQFTQKDILMFKYENTEISLGCRWILTEDNTMYIAREDRILYSFKLNAVIPVKEARYYCYESDIDKKRIEEELLFLLEKRTRHKGVLSMCDIHCHLVNGVDDGAYSISESVALAKVAYEQGVRHIACTSHSWGYTDEYPSQFVKLQKKFKEEGIDILLYPGCEIQCYDDNAMEVLYGIKEGEYRRLGNSNYVMLEFSPKADSSFIYDFVRRLKKLASAEQVNIRIMIAHVERYLKLSISDIEKLKNEGCLLQINAYSLVGEKDYNIKSKARELLDRKLAYALGSDGHRLTHRPIDVKAGIKYIYDNYDVDYANGICYANALNLLGGDKI